MKYTKDFTEISKEDVSLAGGKGASLGEMANAGINVPPGFVIVADACRNFYKKELPPEFVEELLIAFDKLDGVRVAVRSSAIAEDSSTASWAGQLESYLNVPRDGLVEAVQECWNSVFSERAVEYAQNQNVSKDDLTVAVVVQKMVDSEVSGVMFSVNPISKDHDEIMIESTYGLGEMLVQGMVTPDDFVIDKNTFEVKEKYIQNKTRQYVFKNGENVEIDVDSKRALESTLDDDLLIRLSEQAIIIENHYGKPQDIEWGIEDGEIYILQSRPIIGV